MGARVNGVVFCLAIMALLISVSSSSPQLVINDQREFDYFLFVRQWAGSFCHTDSSCPLVHRNGFRLTVHGLWPDYNDGSYPQFCERSDPFDEDKIKDILDVLEDEWPTFFNKEDDFWSHEWLKHGTCALRIMPDEHSYFSTVLKLHHEYDLAAALVSAGIEPSDTVHYERTKVEGAIRAAYGVDALVHCDAAGRLSEVWMCVGKDLHPFNCKLDSSTRCEHVLIPRLADGHAEQGSGSVSGSIDSSSGSDVSGSNGSIDSSSGSDGSGSDGSIDSSSGSDGSIDSSSESDGSNNEGDDVSDMDELVDGEGGHMDQVQHQEEKQDLLQGVESVGEQQRQHGSYPRSSAAEGPHELLRTCIIAVAGAMMLVIVVATVAVSAIKRATTLSCDGPDGCGVSCERGRAGRQRMHEGDPEAPKLSEPLL